MSTNPIPPDNNGAPSAPTGQTEYLALGAMVDSIASEGLDTLLLEQIAQQRHSATLLRSVRRETQRRLIEAQAKKIMEAANNGLYSAIFSSALKFGATVAGVCVSETAGKIISAFTEGVASTNPFSYWQAQANADATRLGGAASIQGQHTQEASEMLQSARQAEQAMLRHLEKFIDTQQATGRAVAGRMGG